MTESTSRHQEKHKLIREHDKVKPCFIFEHAQTKGKECWGLINQHLTHVHDKLWQHKHILVWGSIFYFLLKHHLHEPKSKPHVAKQPCACAKSQETRYPIEKKLAELPTLFAFSNETQSSTEANAYQPVSLENLSLTNLAKLFFETKSSDGGGTEIKIIKEGNYAFDYGGCIQVIQGGSAFMDLTLNQNDINGSQAHITLRAGEQGEVTRSGILEAKMGDRIQLRFGGSQLPTLLNPIGLPGNHPVSAALRIMRIGAVGHGTI